MSLPLSGIVVVELGHSVAAPSAGQALADLGAEVVKVEKTGGDDARFKTNPDRVRNSAALYSLIENEISKHGNAEWTAKLDAARVPCAPVQNVRQMLEHEQTKALGLLQQVPGSSRPLAGLPISFDGQRPLPRAASPALGAHSREVLG